MKFLNRPFIFGFLVTVAATLSSSQLVSADGLGRQCLSFLKNVTSKGPFAAILGWQALNDSHGIPWAPAEASQQIAEVDLGRLIGAGRTIDRERLALSLGAIAADPGATERELQLVLSVIYWMPQFSGTTQIIRQVQSRPDFFEKHLEINALKTYENKSIAGSPNELAQLIQLFLRSAVGPDIAENDVPLSAALASVIADLELSQRISSDVLAQSFLYMVQNPNAHSHSLFWSSGFLVIWVQNLYRQRRRLPKTSIFQPVIDAYVKKYLALDRHVQVYESRIRENIKLVAKLLGCRIDSPGF